MQSLQKFQTHLFDTLKVDSNASIYIAFSGGKDSTVLLHLMQRLREDLGIEITALHVNHNLHFDSANWEAHCKTVCEAWHVPFNSTSVHLPDNSEAAAREVRYSRFARQLGVGDVVLTAHHQQDRVETLLFNLMRGAGSRGLSSMRAVRDFHAGKLVRPLLDWTIDDIDHYARRHKLQWIEDPSNQELRFSRNKIRHTLIPVLSDFRLDAVRNLARAAENLQDEADILHKLALDDLQKIRQQDFNILDGSRALSIKDLSVLSNPRQASVLREWLSVLGVNSPSRSFVLQVLEAIINQPSSSTILQESGLQMRFYDDFLYCLTESIEPDVLHQPVQWDDIDQALGIFSNRLRITASDKLLELSNQNLDADMFVMNSGHINNAKALAGHSLQLKKWFQGQRIPTWRRANTPILCLFKDDQQQLITAIDPGLRNNWVKIETDNI